VKARLEDLWDAIREALLTHDQAEEYFGAPPRGPSIRHFQEMYNDL
jgi:hypothetical protein